MKIFSVYDSKAEAYLRPFFDLAPGAAKRVFANEVNNPQSSFCQHAADFTLFEIGQWDERSGKIEGQTKINHGNGIEFQQINAAIALETEPEENENG